MVFAVFGINLVFGTDFSAKTVILRANRLVQAQAIPQSAKCLLEESESYISRIHNLSIHFRCFC